MLLTSLLKRLTRKIFSAVSLRRFSSSVFILFTLIFSMLGRKIKPASNRIRRALSKLVQKAAEARIPKLLRRRLFSTYSRFYSVRREDIVVPFQEFKSFSAFFTRAIKPRPISPNPLEIIIPADSKVLRIAQIQQDNCTIIKGAFYSLGELLTGRNVQFSTQQISQMKQNAENKLYQIIFYLAPGDYHRFHAPVSMSVDSCLRIQGLALGVSEKVLQKLKVVYEKNARVCLEGKWKHGYIGMVLVGALNVSRIEINKEKQFQKGDQVGYFNLGSTVVLLIEAPNLKWAVQEGEKVMYGNTLCQVYDPAR